MSSTTLAKIPVIDFSKHHMKPNTLEWDLVKVQVREALQEYGCFEAVFDQVPVIQKTIFGSVEELFDLPLQTKKLCVSDKHFNGYSVSTSELLEIIVTDDAPIDGNIEQHITSALWPQGNITFSETMVSFSELVSGLEKIIKRMILESFGLEKYLDELIDSTNYQLRVMKYGMPQTNIEPTPGIRAHCDQNMMTLLYQNEVDGLEIQKKDGEWINVKPSSNSFVVLIGESLSVWLNGRFSVPCHRVVIKGNKVRYSLGIFATPRGGCRVKAPEEFVDDENGLLFKPFDYEEFLGFFSVEIARGARSGLKAYCSV